MTAQPTKAQVVAALRRNGINVPDPPAFVLLDNGWLDVQLDADGGVCLEPAQIYPTGPDCLGLISPHAECVGRNCCPRRLACNE